jgi:hypothetical protein
MTKIIIGGLHVDIQDPLILCKIGESRWGVYIDAPKKRRRFSSALAIEGNSNNS